MSKRILQNYFMEFGLHFFVRMTGLELYPPCFIRIGKSKKSLESKAFLGVPNIPGFNLCPYFNKNKPKIHPIKQVFLEYLIYSEGLILQFPRIVSDFWRRHFEYLFLFYASPPPDSALLLALPKTCLYQVVAAHFFLGAAPIA